jgi:hypothetical protein
MKFLKMALFAGALIIVSASCKKDKASAGDPDSIVGIWELRKTTAAMNPTGAVYASGNGRIVKFSSTAYEIIENGQVTESGQYTVKADGTVQESVCLNISTEEYSKIIVFSSSNNPTKQFFKIENNRLHFIAGCYAYDAGHTKEYARISFDTDTP